jgi:hypothetical protein
MESSIITGRNTKLVYPHRVYLITDTNKLYEMVVKLKRIDFYGRN